MTDNKTKELISIAKRIQLVMDNEDNNNNDSSKALKSYVQTMVDLVLKIEKDSDIIENLSLSNPELLT